MNHQDVYRAWNVATDVSRVLHNRTHVSMGETLEQFNRLFSHIFGVATIERTHMAGYNHVSAMCGTECLDYERTDTLRFND
jgi:hypothetical protein